jgi:hypothetical protein
VASAPLSVGNDGDYLMTEKCRTPSLKFTRPDCRTVIGEIGPFRGICGNGLLGQFKGDRSCAGCAIAGWQDAATIGGAGAVNVAWSFVAPAPTGGSAFEGFQPWQKVFNAAMVNGVFAASRV